MAHPIGELLTSGIAWAVANGEPLDKCPHLKSTHDTWYCSFDYDGDAEDTGERFPAATGLLCEACFIEATETCSLCLTPAQGGVWFVAETFRMNSSKRSDIFATVGCPSCTEDVFTGEWGIAFFQANDQFLVAAKRTTRVRPVCGAG